MFVYRRPTVNKTIINILQSPVYIQYAKIIRYKENIIYAVY